MCVEDKRTIMQPASLLALMLAAILFITGVLLTAQRGIGGKYVLLAFVLAAFLAVRSSRYFNEMQILKQIQSNCESISLHYLENRSRSPHYLFNTWFVPPLVILVLVITQQGSIPFWFWLVCLSYLSVEIIAALWMRQIRIRIIGKQTK